ncbi:MAG TPA: S8 family serine peptidase, partial [Blastocatellia bacterium]|nr:S8 family serine peptidase [Blastocatellia bacterium]
NSELKNLQGQRLYSLDFEKLKTIGADTNKFNDALSSVLEEAIASKGRVILYIDSLPQMIMNVWSEKIVNALASGDLRLIGGSNDFSYKSTIETSAEFGAFFKDVNLDSAKQAASNEAEKESDENKSFSGVKVSDDLRRLADKTERANDLVKVIVQSKNVKEGVLKRYQAQVVERFKLLDAVVVEIPARYAVNLAERKEINYLSPDRPMRAFGHVTATTGADLVRTQTTGTGTTQLNGSGIGIAIIDSGIDVDHIAFNGATGIGNASNINRVVFSKDFTTENRTDDPYGHGTHVAALAAGSSAIYSGNYAGIATNANLINLRVLNSQGRGTTASLLSAMEWVLANRAAYNIRVVNLSLGTIAVDSYRNDPICRAVRRLSDAGVVVFTAAGNNGKSNSGTKIYGLIHSPGIEPSSITVGAANTFGTDSRNDDGVTTYSSRGPTRSFWTD